MHDDLTSDASADVELLDSDGTVGGGTPATSPGRWTAAFVLSIVVAIAIGVVFSGEEQSSLEASSDDLPFEVSRPDGGSPDDDDDRDSDTGAADEEDDTDPGRDPYGEDDSEVGGTPGTRTTTASAGPATNRAAAQGASGAPVSATPVPAPASPSTPAVPATSGNGSKTVPASQTPAPPPPPETTRPAPPPPPPPPPARQEWSPGSFAAAATAGHRDRRSYAGLPVRVTISGAGRIGVSVSDKETWSLDVPRRRLTIEARGTEESGRCQITRGDGGGLEARCALRHRRSEIGVAHLRLLEDLTVDLSHVQHRRHPTTMTLKTGPAKLG